MIVGKFIGLLGVMVFIGVIVSVVAEVLDNEILVEMLTAAVVIAVIVVEGVVEMFDTCVTVFADVLDDDIVSDVLTEVVDLVVLDGVLLSIVEIDAEIFATGVLPEGFTVEDIVLVGMLISDMFMSEDIVDALGVVIVKLLVVDVDSTVAGVVIAEIVGAFVIEGGTDVLVN